MEPKFKREGGRVEFPRVSPGRRKWLGKGTLSGIPRKKKGGGASIFIVSRLWDPGYGDRDEIQGGGGYWGVNFPAKLLKGGKQGRFRMVKAEGASER